MDKKATAETKDKETISGQSSARASLWHQNTGEYAAKLTTVNRENGRT